MNRSITGLALSGLAGAVLGYFVATVVAEGRGEKPWTALGTAQRGLSPSSGSGGTPSAPLESNGASAGKRSDSPSGAADARRAELERDVSALRGRVKAAQREIETSRRRIEALESELAGESEPLRHKFDLAPADWRKLGAEKIAKYRLPCAHYREPEGEVLDELGVAPDEREAIRSAYANSAERQKRLFLPLCAEALGGRSDIANAVGIDACRHIIINTAALVGLDTGESARRIASFMAGDAPLPEPKSRNMLDDALLALVQESSRFEQELAESFGPDDAHRLVFSDRLCFNTGVHQLGESAPH